MKTPWWFRHRTPLAILLLPVAAIYYLVSRAVYGLRRLGAHTSRRPIICVGNILAGGVGKTPIVREIARALDAPVVMRGYKKSAQTGNAGDEAMMLASSGLQVHTGNRWANIKLLNRQKTNAPIVMDDGFQNPRIKKDISIIVFDAGIGVGNGFLLPAGPLREGMRALKRADAVIVIRHPSPARLKLPENIPVFYASNRTINPCPGKKIAAFAGIGYPKKFFEAVHADFTRAFADHYQYTDADGARLVEWAKKHGAQLVTTEKDWMRLSPKMQAQVHVAPLQTVIDNNFYDWLREKVNVHTDTND